jgi:hypothetical protein
MQTFRLLVFGSPGCGKSWFIKHLLQRVKMPGVVGDPNGEFQPPFRFKHLIRPTERQLVKATLKQPAPNLMVCDEIHKLIRKWDDDRNNILVRTMDLARNNGLSFIGSTKFPTMLPPMIVGLASDVMLNPGRLPNVARWLREAGIDYDIADRLPMGEWIWAPVAGDPFRINTEGALRKSQKLLDEVKITP